MNRSSETVGGPIRVAFDPVAGHSLRIHLAWPRSCEFKVRMGFGDHIMKLYDTGDLLVHICGAELQRGPTELLVHSLLCCDIHYLNDCPIHVKAHGIHSWTSYYFHF